MNVDRYTTEQLVDRWEDQRELKNLMGRYMNRIIQNRDAEIFDGFWAKREDICLGFNDGWYVGAEAVSAYYAACRDRHALVAALLQKKFSERIGDKTAAQLFGIGTFRDYPIVSPIIKIAGDGKTAKGLWYNYGSHAELTSRGPEAYWCFGFFAADFVREEDEWKLWHLQFTNDVDARCGTSWGKPAEPYPELAEFAQLKEFKMPAYSVPAAVRAYYSPDRPFTGAPRLPEDYTTFAETFSYGV